MAKKKSKKTLGKIVVAGSIGALAFLGYVLSKGGLAG
jgi:hypothetical protein